MRRFEIAVLCSGALFLPGALRAEVFEPKLEEICAPAPESTRGGTSYLNTLQVQRAIYDKYSIQDVDLDSKGRKRTIAYEDKIEALVRGRDYCDPKKCTGEGAEYCSPTCKKGADDKLASAQAELLRFLARHQTPLKPGEGGFVLARPRSSADVRDLFLRPGAPVACIAAVTPEGLPKHPAADEKSRDPGRLVIRKTIDDLRIGQSDPAFKGVQRASLSINSDRVKQSTSYAIEGVAGYGTGLRPVEGLSDTYFETIPFASYKRQFVQSAKPGPNPPVHNIGAGIVGDLQFPGIGLQNVLPLTRGIQNDLQFVSQVVHSERTDADILSGNLIYTPYINPTVFPGIATTARVGDFLVMLTPQAKYVYGEVLHSGIDPLLAMNSTFSRLGYRAEFSIVADAGPVNGVGFNTSYEFQKVLQGQLNSVERFVSTLSYTMPKQEFWSVQLQYTNGRDLDTLERQKVITLGVGYKY